VRSKDPRTAKEWSTQQTIIVVVWGIDY
jgi:hypothetical protein